MKRRLLKLGLLLLAGAIVNVAVAWGCAFTQTGRSGEAATSKSDLRWPEYLAQANWPGPDAAHRRAARLGVDTLEVEAATSETGAVAVEIFQYGLPVRSMQLHLLVAVPDSDSKRAETLFHDVLSSGLPFKTHAIYWHSTALPVAPIGLGFAIDTGFYSATLWLLFFAPFKLRRWRRIRRGLCPACAYPVGSSDKCTECGKPVTARSVESAT